MKIFGLPLWGVLVAFVVFYALGVFWYGMFFSDIWIAGHGYTEAELEGSSPMWMLLGFPQTFAQVIGLGFILKWRGWPDLQGAVTTAVVLGICFALPFAAYQLIYSVAHSLPLFFVDASHLFVGWVASAAIMTMMR